MLADTKKYPKHTVAQQCSNCALFPVKQVAATRAPLRQHPVTVPRDRLSTLTKLHFRLKLAIGCRA